MGIQYDFYANPPQKGSNKPSLHARVKPTGTVKTAEIFELVHECSTLTTADSKAALEAFLTVLKSGLQSGKSVHFEGLGLFQLTLDCPPTESPDEHRAESIKVRSVSFRPDAELVDAFRTAKMERVREKYHSRSRSAEEVEALLDKFFQSNEHITRREFCGLCGFTYTTGMRRINDLIAEGKLRKVKHGNGVYER